MSQDSGDPPVEMAESASVGQAGEPQRADRAGGPQEEQAPPTPEELDARDEVFSRPRKPMGPVETGNPETIPDEG
jgi:hypothetical protein